MGNSFTNPWQVNDFINTKLKCMAETANAIPTQQLHGTGNIGTIFSSCNYVPTCQHPNSNHIGFAPKLLLLFHQYGLPQIPWF